MRVGDAPVTTKLLLLIVTSMAPESTLKCSVWLLCQWRPGVQAEPTGTVKWVLEGVSKEWLAAPGGGVVKVERWVVRVRLGMVVGGSTRSESI